MDTAATGSTRSSVNSDPPAPTSSTLNSDSNLNTRSSGNQSSSPSTVNNFSASNLNNNDPNGTQSSSPSIQPPSSQPAHFPQATFAPQAHIISSPPSTSNIPPPATPQKPPPPLPWNEPLPTQEHIPPTLPSQVATVSTIPSVTLPTSTSDSIPAASIPPPITITTPHQKNLLHSRSFIAVAAIILVLGGFAGSFFIASLSNKSSNDLASRVNTQPTIAIAPTKLPTSTPKPTESPVSMFISPTIAFTNPFISPTVAFSNPFGDYENPFATNATDQASYVNPFSTLVKGAF